MLVMMQKISQCMKGYYQPCSSYQVLYITEKWYRCDSLSVKDCMLMLKTQWIKEGMARHSWGPPSLSAAIARLRIGLGIGIGVGLGMTLGLGTGIANLNLTYLRCTT